MQTFLTDYTGKSYEMPVLLRWDFFYGDSLPCDAFEVCYIYKAEMLPILPEVTRFRAVHNGETVFSGVVDEFEVSYSDRGGLVYIRGRGLAALLLDNEAEAAEYFSVGLDSILNNYVYSCGISDVRRNISVPNQAIVVDSGTSCWRVLEDFMWFGSKTRPRFSRDGVLILGCESGKRFIVDRNIALTAQRLRQRRYGVLSEVLVKNKALGTVDRVFNDEFVRRGGSCRRVINVPRYTRYDAMRSTGEYQIACSKEDKLLLSITVPQLFAAFPGDIVEFTDLVLGVKGNFVVGRTNCFARSDDAGTEIIMTSREA